MKKIMKGAVVLLIAVAMIFSTTAVTAETEEQQMTPEFIKNTNQNTIKSDNLQSMMGPVLYEQLPIPESGSWTFRTSSTDAGYRVHDNFPDINEEICDIHWWGLSLVYPWEACDPTGMVFEIIFWNGLMQDPVCTYQVSPTAVGTGEYYAGFEQYYWEAQLDPCCYMPGGGWVSIQSIDSPNGCWFLWASSADGDMYCYQEGSTTPDGDSDCAFQLTAFGEPCDPCIDVEKYVLDKDGNWVDADTQDEALDILICKDATFKITIKNCGDVDLVNLVVKDKMHDSLKFINGDPEPDEWYYEEPFYYLDWYIPLLPVDGSIDIFVTAHVEGPECSYDFNYVLVEAEGCEPPEVVRDEDYAWVHATEKSVAFNTPILNFLQSHQYMFPLLKLLLQQLDLF
jgi:hypothetical protein